MTRLFILPNDQVSLIIHSDLPAEELAGQINAGSLPAAVLEQTPGSLPPLRALVSGSAVIVLPAEALKGLGGAAAVKIGWRQRQVLQAVVDGKTTQQIARSLHLSPSTIEQSIQRLRARLNAENRQQLVARALMLGLCRVNEGMED